MANLRTNIKNFFDKLFHLHIESSEKRVVTLKQETIDKVEEVNVTLQKAGHLQNKVIKKTTTYYLGKAAGVIS